jgi:predicted NBD/HSP70 family sugar kinase
VTPERWPGRGAVGGVGPADSLEIRRYNRRLVVHVVRLSGPLSRARICDATGLQPATVTNIVGELIEQGLVHEVGLSRSKSTAGGRPQVLLDLRADALRVAGVYVGIRRVYVSIGDVKGAVLARERHLRPATPAGTARVAASTLRRLARGAGVPLQGIAAIGLALVASPLPSNPDAPLAARYVRALERELGRPVFAESGPVAMARAEGLFGGVGEERCILVHLGTTVGAGVQWGHPLLGRFGRWASPLGHVVVDPNGDACSCGARGCLDTIASEPHLVARAIAAVDAGRRTVLSTPGFDVRKRGVEAIAEAAARGDDVATSLVDDAASALAKAIAAALQVLAVDLAIVAGPILLADAFMQRLTADVARLITRPVRVRGSAFGLDAPFVAGLGIALDRAVFGPWPAQAGATGVALSARS